MIAAWARITGFFHTASCLSRGFVSGFMNPCFKRQLRSRLSRHSVLPGVETGFIYFLSGYFFAYLEEMRNALAITRGLVLPYYVVVFLVLIGPFFYALSFFTLLKEGRAANLRRPYRGWFKTIFAVVLFCLAWGIFFSRNIARNIVVDLIVFPGFFAAVLAGTGKKDFSIFDRILTVSFLLSAVFCILSWRSTPQHEIDLFMNMRRAWILPYCIWGTLYVWPYFFLSIGAGSLFRRISAYLGISVFFIMAFYFQKRSVFLSLCILLVLLVFKSKLIAPRLKKMPNVFFESSLFCLIFAVSLQLLNFQANYSHAWKYFRARVLFLTQPAVKNMPLVDSSSEHAPAVISGIFDKEYFLDQLRNEQRFSRDFSIATRRLGLSAILFGHGLGAPADESGYKIHNGVFFIIQKGGLLFLVSWLFGWFFLLRDFIKNNNFDLNRYYAPALLLPLMFFMISSFSTGVDFIVLSMCAGRAMTREHSDA